MDGVSSPFRTPAHVAAYPAAEASRAESVAAARPSAMAARASRAPHTGSAASPAKAAHDVLSGRVLSDVVGNDERRAIASVSIREQTIRFVVADDLLGLRIEAKLPAETV